MKLYKHYNVNKDIDLATKMGVPPQTLSGWRTRHASRPIIKKCEQLGIYDEIDDEGCNFNFIEFNCKLALLRESDLRALRAVLKSASASANDSHEDFYILIDEAILDNSIFKKMISFCKDDEVITQKHFLKLKDVLPLFFKDADIDCMVIQREQIINSLNTLIRHCFST